MIGVFFWELRNSGRTTPTNISETPKAEEIFFYLAIFLFNGAEGAEDFFEICAGGAKQNTETPKLRKIRIINLETQEP